jgi:hypothetical protein
LNACGYVTRIIFCGLGVQGLEPSWKHGTNEVWSNTYCKWVAIDPQENHHFEKNGVPLSALEVRDEYQKGNIRGVIRAVGVNRTPSGASADGGIEMYNWVEWNAYGNHTSGYPAENEFYFWFQDAYSQSHTWYNSGSPHWLYSSPSTMRWISQRDSIEWTPNVVKVTPSVSGSTLNVTLANCMPNFKEYQIKDITAGGTWAVTTAGFSRPLSLSHHEWAIRAVNLVNVTAPEYRLVVDGPSGIRTGSAGAEISPRLELAAYPLRNQGADFVVRTQAAGALGLQIVDFAGRSVWSRDQPGVQAGTHTIVWAPANGNTAAGPYLAILSQGMDRVSAKLILR